MSEVLWTLGVALGLLIVGFATLAYALVAVDALARRWFHWRHRIR